MGRGCRARSGGFLWGCVWVCGVLIAHNCKGLAQGLIFALCVALFGVGVGLCMVVCFRAFVGHFFRLVWCGSFSSCTPYLFLWCSCGVRSSCVVAFLVACARSGLCALPCAFCARFDVNYGIPTPIGCAHRESAVTLPHPFLNFC